MRTPGEPAAAERARKADPRGFRANADVKLLAAIARLILEVVPADPSRPEYRLGNALGSEYRNWFRAKFGGRFRLFFRYDGRARLIVFAWVNDEQTLRKRGAKSDPYAVFRAMLKRGDPPADWDALAKAAGEMPTEVAEVMEAAGDDDRSCRHDLDIPAIPAGNPWFAVRDSYIVAWLVP